jgi:Mg-chelatase subunit ChlD
MLAARHGGLEQVSPEVGVLDEEAFEDQLAEDPDEALALLADLAAATDPALALLARRLAGRIAIRLAGRAGGGRRSLGGRLRTRPWRDPSADLDLDASLDTLVQLRSGQGASLEDLSARTWVPPSLALCLLVDRSGSMGGERLATAALAAAAVSQRAPTDHSVAVFADEVVVLRSQGETRPVDAVVSGLLSLKGRGTTDLAAALGAATEQLDRSRASRRVTVLLSDCRATAGGEPLPAAAALEELVVLAPADDATDAQALAAAVGARCVPVAGPSSLPEALAAALAS